MGIKVKNALFMLTIFLTLVFSNKIVSADTIAETEDNDTTKEAQVLASGITVTGNLSSLDDIDCYKFVATKNGKITIDFNYEKIASNTSSWGIKAYKYNKNTDKCEKVLKDCTDTLGGYDEWPESFYPTFEILNATKGDVYFIVIANDSGKDVVGHDYNLCVKSVSGKNYESESNNTKDMADTIVAGKTCTGVIQSAKDSDWYKIVAPANGLMYVAFLHDNVSGDYSDWNVKIYKYVESTGKYKRIYRFIGNNPDDGNCSTPYFCAKAGTTYLVCIRKGTVYNSVGREYKVKAVFSLGYFDQPASASTTSNTATIRWNSIKHVDGYIIYKYDTTLKKYVRIKKVDSSRLVYKVKNLDKNTKYRFKIRAYKKVDGRTYYSEDLYKKVVTKE